MAAKMKQPLFYYMHAVVRLILRRLRRRIYWLAGLNPFAVGRHAPTVVEEWNAVLALLLAQGSEPQLLAGAEDGCRWKTCVGEYLFPRGLDPMYIKISTEEQAVNVYGISERDRTVVDCGANVGLFTKHALKQGAQTVIAFEPSLNNAACFRHNLAEELRDGRVLLIEKGVLDREGEARFFTPVKDPFAHQIADDGNTAIPVTTLDRALESLGLDHVDFVKIDIEGSELLAIEGAKGVLEGIRPRVAIATEHTRDYFENAAKVIDRMISLGYDYVSTQSLAYYSPTRSKTLMVPLCVLFTPRPRP